MDAAAEEGKIQDLYDALRTGDYGVSFEHFIEQVYFLQHRCFTLFDAKDAFQSSCSGPNDMYLSYREFHIALQKIARIKFVSVAVLSDAQSLTALLAEISQSHDASASQMDKLRHQIMKRRVLEVLEHHLPKLIQSFQLYGAENRIKHESDMSSTMTLDGFVDFLNAYFEYEEYFSFQAIENMVKETNAIFAVFNAEPDLKPNELNFPQFIELLCRVASEYHNQVLVREGAHLRRAVESRRLEFSIELLLQMMDIKLLRDGTQSQPNASSRRSSRIQRGSALLDVISIESNSSHDDGDSKTFEAIVSDIKKWLEDAERKSTAYRQFLRGKNLLLEPLPVRKNLIESTTSPRGVFSKSTELPQLTMIREIISPPPLPTSTLKQLEHAIVYQNLGQYHMALDALNEWKFAYEELREHLSEDAQVQVYYYLMAASIHDSARKDLQAIRMYFEALKSSDQLPQDHLGRILAVSSVGCMLYYTGEIAIAKQCHQLVLLTRKHATKSGGEEHLDTATAMNNLACCLSQTDTETSIGEAYLLLKMAKRIYTHAFGATHPRAEVLLRNLERVKTCQKAIVIDPVGALKRGKYAHIIPGSRFQIQALVPIDKPTKAVKKKQKNGKKKK